MKNLLLLLTGFLFILSSITAQENLNRNKFKQLGQELPTPNIYRTASGAPGMSTGNKKQTMSWTSSWMMTIKKY